MEIWLSDNDLVPDEVQNELIMIRSRLTKEKFRIGDIANRLVLEAAKSGKNITAHRIHKAVGNFVGKRPRTIRYYAENAAFYSEYLRDTYDFLAFSVFDYARGFGEDYHYVLDLSAENPNKSVAWLRLEYRGEITSEESPSSSRSCADITVKDGGLGCAQTDLNDSDKASVAPHYQTLEKVGVSPVVGSTAAEFHLIAEVELLVQRANEALSVVSGDERIPEDICKDIRLHMSGLQVSLVELAHLIDMVDETAEIDHESYVDSV